MGTIKDHRLFANPDGSLHFYKPLLSSQKRVREVLGYELDHGHFANVCGPIFSHEEGVSSPFLSSSKTVHELSFSTKEELPPEMIRRLALFDLRFLNRDRHEENLLWDGTNLFLIDHAEILPEKWMHGHFCWALLPQARTAFSSEEIDYISSLPLEEDTHKISQALSHIAAKLFFISSHLILCALRAKWTAYAISRLFSGSKNHHSPFHILTQELSTISDFSPLKEKIEKVFHLKWSHLCV